MSAPGTSLLVFRIGQLGDALVALPALRSLQAAFPDARIVLLSDGDDDGNRVGARTVLEAEGIFDSWLEWPAPAGGVEYVRRMFRLLGRLRSEAFTHLAYLAPRQRRGVQVLRDLAFFRAAGINKVVGHRGIRRLDTRSATRPLAPATHEAEHLLGRLRASGIPALPLDGRSHRLRPTGPELEWATDLLRRGGVNPSDRPIVALAPGSKWPSKIWPESRYLEVTKALGFATGAIPVVFGGPEDRSRGERILAAVGRGLNLAGATTVRQSAALLSLCDVYVGNDTGTMHLAAAAGTPCVAVVSAQDWPGRWSPLGPGHALFRRQVSCEGCMQAQCPRRDLRCLEEIGAAEVSSAAEALIKRRRRAVSDVG